MKKGKRILAFLVALSLLNPIVPGMISKVNAGTPYAYTAENNLEDYAAGATLSEGTYYLSKDMAFDGSEIGNGLKIAEEATVVIYLNGHTLTASGENAIGTEKGYAGILLPKTSTLIFIGEGTVNAIGGNAANGASGANGSNGWINESSKTLGGGNGGAGGTGGGGAGAGIGTDGSNGGAGGAGGTGPSSDAPGSGKCNDGPNNGTDGSDSANVSDAGRLLVYSNGENAIVMNLVGGNAGTKGAGGSVGTSYYDKGSGWKNNYTASAGAAGGGGAAGATGSGYGPGGVGGAGGAGGASGAVYSNGDDGWRFRFGMGGQGGQGATDALSGTAGVSASSSRKVGIDGSDDYSTGDYGSAASGGSIGTAGSAEGYTTYYLNGLYARISSINASGEIKTYQCDDNIYKDEVDVYAIYSTNSGDIVSDVIGRIKLSGDATDGFTNAVTISDEESDLIRAHRIENTYWDFENEGASGEHQITSGEIQSITATDTSAEKTGKINIRLNTNSYANCSTFVRDIRIAMDAQQTINKEDGTDDTVQDALGDYPTSGEAAMYNEEKAIKTIIYDNDSHSIAELVAGTGYGESNGADSSAEITDDFFKNGLTTNSGEAYWYADYAQTPYYKVEYKPFNAFIDYSATNAADIQGNVSKEGTNLTYAETNYLTGSKDSVMLDGTKYSDTANAENGEYVLNGEVDKYFAEGQIDKPLIKNAGIYTVTVVVPYRYFTYTYTDDTWYGDTVSNDNYSYFFHTYTFNIVVREADLGITEATDTVYENTKVQAHAFDRYVEGQNDEQVYGQFTYASGQSAEWGTGEDRIVNKNQTQHTNIEWEFNVYDDEYKDSSKNQIDGHKNINNYLCQVDGASAEKQKSTSKDVQNTYYKGYNGSLVYTSSTIATRDANMIVWVNHAEEQNNISGDNEKIASDKLVLTGIPSTENDVKIDSVYAEDIEISAVVISDSLGWRVVKDDAVTGTALSGTKIESAEDLAEGYQTEEYYNKLVEDGKYKGDLYVVTVMAGDEVVKTFEYTDETARNTVNNIRSELAKQITDELPACEYYGVSAYDVKVEYIGLYYTGETSTNGRRADWNGEEEFNWIISQVNFKIDVAQRDVAIKDTADVNKTYDSTTYLVKQTLTSGDVTSASKYIVDLAKDNTDTQFAKKPNTLLYNYIDPTDELTNTMSVEVAGEYDNENKGKEKEVTIIEARLLDGTTIPESGDKVTALNYHIVDGNEENTGIATVTGNVDVAQMHYTHALSASMTARDNTPLHELFGITVKSYLLDATKEESGEFLKSMTMNYSELVEKNDEKTETNDTFTTSGDAYDYDATYQINTTDYKQYITGSNLVIDEDTGKIMTASTVTKGGTNPSNFPAMDIKLVDYANFTVVPETDEIETDTYNECIISGENSRVASDENVEHTVRFRIVGNSNNYDLLLPFNQLNEREAYSSFIGCSTSTVAAGENDFYEYVAVYPNNDSAEFEFTILQDSYLEDVAIVALEDFKVYDEDASMKTYEELITAIKEETANVIGTYETQSNEDGMNNIENALFLTLDEVNGAAYTDTKLQEPNAQIGGSTFKFTFTTGECNLGENYAIVIVPITGEYDKNILADDAEGGYKANLSVEKAVTSSGDSTLTYETAQDDYVYVNYKTLFNTAAGGTVTMSYEGAEDLVLTLGENNMNEFNSFAINTEENSEFFNPETLIPETEVTVDIEVWRDGVVEGIQRSGDSNAFDFATFTWTVSGDDYYRLFKDDVVTVRSDSTIEEDNNIETEQVIDNILGYVLSGDEAFNKISKYVTNHKTNMETKDDEWSIQSDFDLLGKYIEGIYHVDGTEMEVDETTYQVEGLALGMSVYPYKTYTVTFDVNGGSGDVESQEIVKGQKATKPEDPTYGELHFAGWFVNPTLDNILKEDSETDMGYSFNTFDFNTAITEDIELKALWRAILQVNVSGAGNGAIAKAMEGEELEFDEEYPADSIYDNTIILGLNNTVQLGAKEDEGSVFVKWTKNGEDYSTDKVITVTITDNTEFRAVFDEKMYTVTYDANGGTETMDPETTKYFIFPDCGFTAPDGKKFDKWEVNGRKYKVGDTLTLTEDITVKATWKTPSTSGGGGGSSVTTYKITTKVENGKITPSNPSVAKNKNQEFTFKAKDGYEIADVLVDGKSIGAVETYKLEKVTAKHTIELKVKEAEKEKTWNNASEWAIEELTKAIDAGVIPETFAGKDFTTAITRKDFAAVAVKLYEALTNEKAEKVAINPFTDTDDEYVLKAYALGITNGTSQNTFTPDMLITREQMATMLTRALNKAGINLTVDLDSVSRFADDSEMHDWGREAVYFMANNGIIKGVGDNRFDTLGNATIEQSLIIALRSVDVFVK